MNSIKKFLIALLCCIVAFGQIFTLTAYAVREIVLTVEYVYKDLPLSGAKFDIYKIADTDDNRNLYPIAPFNRYAIDFGKTDSQTMHAMAFTLASYIARDSIEPYDTGVTDEQGRAVFPNNAQSLTTGLYLIVGHNVKIDDIIYSTEPFLAYLPDKAEDGTLSYSVIARPKSMERVPDPTGGGYQKLKVLKIWDDNDSTARPEEITVDLIRDGQVIDSVVLNKDNLWRYTWTKLDFEGEYYAVEREVPDGYTVLTTIEGITFTITNKKNPLDVPTTEPEETTNPEGTTSPEGTTLPEDTTKPEDNTKPEESTTSEESTTNSEDTTKPQESTTKGGGETDESDKPDEPKKPNLPQTGMLRWPIPYLACIGLALFMAGWVRNRKSEIENED